MVPLELRAPFGCFLLERRRHGSRRQRASARVARIVRFVMKRTRQSLRSAATPSCPKSSRTAGSRSRSHSFGGAILPQPIGLYGHSVWDVCRAGGSVSKLRTGLVPAFTGVAESETPRRPVRQVSSQNIKPNRTAYSRHGLGRKLRSSVHLANSSAREIKTDFTFLIGVANLVAFETMMIVALLLCWYVSSS
jgi:hypothetical protein